MTGYREIAELIARRVRRRNDIVGAAVVADLGLSNDTPTVTVSVGGTTRRAVYLAPHAVRAGFPVFVTRLGPDKGAPLAVVATNYQVGPVAAGGLGTGGLGTAPLGG